MWSIHKICVDGDCRIEDVADEEKRREKEFSEKVFVRITFIIGALSVHLTFMYIITLSPSIAACASLSLPLTSCISL